MKGTKLLYLFLIIIPCIFGEKLHLRHQLRLNTEIKSTVSNSFDDMKSFMKIDSKDFCGKYNAGLNIKVDDDETVYGVSKFDPWNVRICDNNAAFFYDKIDPIFEKPMKQDWQEAFDFFQKSAKFDNNAPVVEQTSESIGGTVTKVSHKTTTTSSDDNQKISLPQLVAGAQGAAWIGEITQAAMMKKLKKYDMNGDNALYMKEFLLLMIDEWKGADEYTFGADKCQHCFKNVRKNIGDMFRFMDCNDDGMISSEDLFNGMKHLKVNTEIELTTATTNDVILKSDKNGNAKLTLPEFNSVILTGYWQRMMDQKNIGEEYKKFIEMRKVNRKKNIITNPPYYYGN